MEGGWFHPPAEGSPEENYSIAIPPPNVTGALHMGHALNGIDPGRPDPPQPDAGPQHDVDPRHRSRRDRDPGGGREGARRRRAPRARSSAARRSSSGSGSGRSSTARRSSSSTSASAPPATTSASASPSTRATCRRSTASSSSSTTRARSTATTTWSTGIPGRSSAISDLEIENREVTDTLYEIAYPLEDGGELIVATVRPETMLADTAVAVNPDDERYRDVVGKHAILPLVERPPAGDRRRARRPRVRHRRAQDHARPRPERLRDRRASTTSRRSAVIGEDGRITDEAPERFRGHDRRGGAGGGRRRAARAGADPGRGAVHALRPVLAPLGRADRAADLAAVVLPDGRDGEAGDRGRQRREGADHPRRAPAPATSTGWRRSRPGASPASSGGGTGCRSGTGATRPTSARSRPRARGWEQDEDVLDTWFSSALWPFATLGWPDTTRPSSRRSSRPTCWSPRGTSSSSGSRG